ncbi:MAG: diaminopimelate decarboxylase family protein [Promethearchaeota archaeon]
MKCIAGNPFIKKKKDNIVLDQLNINHLLNEFKTPLLIFLENRIRNNINTFKDVISSQFERAEAYYSVKANFLPNILSIIKSEGIGAEVITLPELKLTLKLGFQPNKIIVGGPYLSKNLINLSVKQKVKEIIIYNLKDLNRVNEVARDHQNVQDVCLRINSTKYNSRLGIIVDENSLTTLKETLKNCPNLSFSTLLSHYGSQMNNPKLFEKNITVLLETAIKLKELGIEISRINMGGGFPEATVMPKKQLLNIMNSLKNQINNFNLNSIRICFEPGRYFIGDAGVFLSKIVAIKPDRWIFLNIGNHICPKFARNSLRFYNASRIEESHKVKTSIAGIIPSDQDVLAKDYFFTEKIEEGDKIMVTNVGAYTLTFSNRFPYTLPKILLINRESYQLIFDSKSDHDISLN